MRYNRHAASYIWKRLGKTLDMDRTLTENGIEDDEHEVFRLLQLPSVTQTECGLDVNVSCGDGTSFVPSLHLYFNDDLTIA